MDSSITLQEKDLPSSKDGQVDTIASPRISHDSREVLNTSSIDPILTRKMILVNNAVDEIGMTPFHWKLFLLNGFGYAVDSSVVSQLLVVCQSIAQPAVEAEFGNPSKHVKGIALASQIGLLVGAVIWGFSADIIGRRLAFNSSLFVCAIFVLIDTDSEILISRSVAIYSAGAGGNYILDATNFLEFLPHSHAWLVTFMSIWWAVGYTITGLLAWAFMSDFSCPADATVAECTRQDNMGWRYLHFTCGALVIVMAIMRLLVIKMIQTPRWLIAQNRDEEVIKNLNDSALKYNRGFSLTLEELEAEGRVLHTEKSVWSNVRTKMHFKGLFQGRKLGISTVIIIANWFVIGMVSPLYSVFLPYYLKTRGAQSGENSNYTTHSMDDNTKPNRAKGGNGQPTRYYEDAEVPDLPPVVMRSEHGFEYIQPDLHLTIMQAMSWPGREPSPYGNGCSVQKKSLNSQSTAFTSYHHLSHYLVNGTASSPQTTGSIVANETSGNVSNADGLITGSAPTLLTRTTTADDPPTVVVDFGQNVVGFLSIDFDGASTNSPGIRLAFSETLQYLTNVSDFSRSDNGDTITPGSDQVQVAPDPYTWTDTWGCFASSTQVCADGLHGFRYVKIYLDALAADSPFTNASGFVGISSLSLNFTGFLGTEDTFSGWFLSSDDGLNQFWYDAIYTNDMTTDTFRENDVDPRGSFTETLAGKLVLFDGAKRDRDPYVGDLAVSARTSYISHNLSQAPINILGDLAEHQRSDGWIPPASINNYTLTLLDYPMWWVTCVHDLYLYTGNSSFPAQYYQSIINVLDTFYPSVTDNSTNLITKGVGVSGSYGDYAFIDRTGAITYFNALYVLALTNAASIATFLGGHDDDVTRWTDRAQTVSAAINANLFDSSVGAFFDGQCDGTPCATHAQDGNSISVLAGVSSPAVALSSLDYLAANNARAYGNSFYDNDVVSADYSQRVYAFISYFEIEARFVSGLAASALEEIRRLYGWMASQDPGITMWEGIGDGGSKYEGAFTSLAHGWSTGVASALTNYVLGVIPTAPGFDEWAVKPIPGDVTWASGVVPTPNGALRVDWTNDTTSGVFTLTISSPSASSGLGSVPVSSNTTAVAVDGTAAWGSEGSVGFGATYADGYIGRLAF
ncbi:hypothetical protein B7494_g1991 [Chlorociboria aeruginascens]|nr:hypothetical protein B7494_g1991 [Chlorociboria aeruginascens]